MGFFCCPHHFKEEVLRLGVGIYTGYSLCVFRIELLQKFFLRILSSQRLLVFWSKEAYKPWIFQHFQLNSLKIPETLTNTRM